MSSTTCECAMSGKPADKPSGCGERPTLVLAAPAKVNLFLKILGKRPDGYHDLESLMLKLELADELVLRPRTEPGIGLRCPGSDLPVDADNLVYRAAAAFYDRAGLIPALEIVLSKKIPVAAGLGGGSSDAAAVLRGLSRWHPKRLAAPELLELARELGADVPFFLQDAPAALARGVGEILTPRPVPADIAAVLLVNPGFAVSTAWVYRNLAGNFPLTKRDDPYNLSGSLTPGGSGEAGWVNDLEAVTMKRFPLLAALRDELLAGGAGTALMAGSGPTIFGLFDREDQAAACAAAMQSSQPTVILTRPLAADV